MCLAMEEASDEKMRHQFLLRQSIGSEDTCTSIHTENRMKCLT